MEDMALEHRAQAQPAAWWTPYQ